MSAVPDSLRALYGPGVAELRHALPDIGDGLQAAFATLHDDPLADAAEMLAIRLEGARRHVLQLSDALRREAVGDAAA